MKIDFTTLNKETFEELCKRLLTSENPEIKTIDGSGGDEGVDSFKGVFNKEIKIWQFKFFIRRIKASQRKQIENSLKTAREKHKLKEWILCIPLELNPYEEKWFENLKQKKENKGIKISHLNEHHLRNLIQKHKTVRDEFFRGEEKEQLDRIEKLVNKKINEEGIIKELIENNAYMEQLSAFKIRIINKDSNEVIKYLKEGISFRQGLGFKNFKKIKDKFHKSSFHIPSGNSILRMNLEDEENPFKIIVPYSTPVEMWVKNIIPSSSTVAETHLTFFTSNYHFKQVILKIIKECLPEDIILKEIEFHKKIKGMVSGKDKYALTTTTVKLDPNIIEKVSKGVGEENIDVEIRSNIIHSKKGGLPKTQFMQKALSLVKSIRKENKISDIIFFRAKQTARAISGKIVTLEVHNDGRVRIWFKKSDYKNRKEMMASLDKFIDKNI